jgi:hypothetical protein
LAVEPEPFMPSSTTQRSEWSIEAIVTRLQAIAGLRHLLSSADEPPLGETIRPIVEGVLLSLNEELPEEYRNEERQKKLLFL